MKCTHCSSDQYSINVTCANCGIIYKALPHWVGLTDEEIDALESATDTLEFPQTVRAIEAKLKENNT